MRLDYLDPIIESAKAVLSNFTGAPVVRGSMRLRGDASSSKEVGAVVGMAGEVEGRIMLEMARDTAIGMAGKMNQERFTELSPLALDTLMELTNVLVAKAISELNDRGYSFRLTPPLIFTGDNMKFFGNLNIESLIIPMSTSVGELDLNIALRMNVL
jgi:chemotaxis protein CheX